MTGDGTVLPADVLAAHAAAGTLAAPADRHAAAIRATARRVVGEPKRY